jgi:AcrR family transcriptional regulator
MGSELKGNRRAQVVVPGADSDGLSLPAKRRVGRPRSEASGNTILTVTLKLLGERGYGGLTIDEVVAQARVSKSTIYRRWPTKEELVVAAFDLLPKLKVPDRGSLIAEWVELARQYERALHQTPVASVVPALISEAAHNPALAQRIEVTFLRRRLPGRLIVTRAVARGELPVETDIELVSELFWAPLVQRAMFAGNHMDTQVFRGMFEVIRAGIWDLHRRQSHARETTSAARRPAATPRASRSRSVTQS